LPYLIWKVQATSGCCNCGGGFISQLAREAIRQGIFYLLFIDAAAHWTWGPGHRPPTPIVFSAMPSNGHFNRTTCRLSKSAPWPYPYQAAVMFRHDLEAIPSLIDSVESSAEVEYLNGAKGEYYFCTGALREDYSPSAQVAEIASLQRAIFTI